MAIAHQIIRAGTFRGEVDEEVGDGAVGDVGHFVQGVTHPKFQRTHVGLFCFQRFNKKRSSVSTGLIMIGWPPITINSSSQFH